MFNSQTQNNNWYPVTNLGESAPNTSKVTNNREGNWGSKWEFMLSCVGFSVGIGNVWRFPYVAYQNGGGAFLIPYLIMLILAGKPLYFMELSFGQFSSESALQAWKCTPIAKGIGASMVVISLTICIYYNVIMSYSLFFIRYSFSSPLPWQTCDQNWAQNTNCTIREKNSTYVSNEITSSQIFWERKVLDISPGIDNIGAIKWDILVCHLINWVIVCLCILKGIKSVGKVVYFTATFPYIILVALLVAGATQQGSWNGIRYFFEPDWNKLWKLDVWQAAAGQMFFSLGISMGPLIMFGSNNDFRHNVFRDAYIVSLLDTFTSVLAGIVTFSVLGAMANDLGVPVDSVVSSGFGLAFIVYPEALTRLPLPQLWSSLFFFMLFCLGIDSQFAFLENIICSLSDEIKVLRKHRVKFTIAVCVFGFLIGLSCVTRGGLYVIDLMDHFCGSLSLIFIAICECITIMWIYGYKRFAFDIKYMLNRNMGIYWRLTWVYTSPIILTFIFIFYLIDFHPLAYGNYGNYNWIGICLTLFIILQVPVWATIVVLRRKNCKNESYIKRLLLAFKCNENWGPKDVRTKQEWRVKYCEHKITKYSAKLVDMKKLLESTQTVSDVSEART